jgi:hypothetical protein
MSEETILDVTAEQVLDVVARTRDLPWPDGDEVLAWELDGIEGQTTWMTHVVPLAAGAAPDAIEVLASAVRREADRRWPVRRVFDASRYTDDATTDPASYDRRSAPAGLVRSLGADAAVWWRHAGHAVLLVDSSEAAAADERRLVVLVLPEQWLAPPGWEEQAVRSPLVADLVSGDGERVLAAAWAVLRTRDPEVLGPLAQALPAIEEATNGLDLGGALVSNASHVTSALARVALFRRGICLCTAYPSHQFHDPAKEEGRGLVRVVGEVPNDRQWEPDRICVCTDCGRRYQVEHGEYHYPWWRWVPLKESRRR